MLASRTVGARRPEGFTLVEIMIVVAIIGLLTTMALPNFAKARDTARLNAIYHNLRAIDSAKEQWALANNKQVGAAVADVSELKDYLRAGGVLEVMNETYTPNPVGTPPIASLPGGAGLGPYKGGADIPAP